MQNVRPSGHTSALRTHLSTESIRKTSQWLCWITDFLFQPQYILANETEKIHKHALTPEASTISIYFQIQDTYLWSPVGCPWWQYSTGLEWSAALSSLVCNRKKGARWWILKIQVLSPSAGLLVTSWLFQKLLSHAYTHCLKMYVRRPVQPLHQAYFLYSANSFNMSSFESLPLSCLYKGENFPSASRVPWESLNTGLQKRKDTFPKWW